MRDGWVVIEEQRRGGIGQGGGGREGMEGGVLLLRALHHVGDADRKRLRGARVGKVQELVVERVHVESRESDGVGQHGEEQGLAAEVGGEALVDLGLAGGGEQRQASAEAEPADGSASADHLLEGGEVEDAVGGIEALGRSGEQRALDDEAGSPQ